MTQAEEFERRICNQALRQDLRVKSVRAAIFSGTGSAGDFVIRIVSTAVLARLVLPEHFGLVMMVTAVTGIADQLRELGLSTATVQQKEITHGQVTNLFWINALTGFGIAGLICALSPLVSDYYRDPRLTAITCVLATNFLFDGLMVQHQALLTRQLKLGHISFIRLLTSAVSAVLGIVLAWKGFGYWALVWREVSRSVLMAAGMWICFPWIPGLPSRRTNVRRLLGFGANLTLANILGSVSAGADRFLIGRAWGAVPVGIYRQGYQLIAVPTDQVPAPIYQVAQPGLCMLQTDDSRYRRYYQKVLMLVCIIVMPISLFVAAYSPEVTRVLLGRKWLDCAPILVILSFGTFIKQAVGSAAWVLITRGHAKTYLGITILQNATVIVFMLVGVRWGIKGVALADLAATYLLIWPKLHYCLKNSPVNIGAFFAAIARPAFASIAMYLALVLARAVLPALSAPACLVSGCLIGMMVFALAWIVIPGGKAELTGIISDFRHALERKAAPAKPAGEAVAVN
jgi:PST family polysaccharide transporter